MCTVHLLLCADPNLGRLDYSLLPDQALMEMLIEGFDDKAKEEYQNGHGMYLDVCEWSGIECDANGRVTDLRIHDSDISGSIELCYLPPKVNVLMLTTSSDGKLTGSVDLTRLPTGRG